MNTKQVIFIHITKTGGTSLVEFFRKRLTAEAVMSHGDFFVVTDNPALPAATVAQKRFVSGHFGYDYVRDYLPTAYFFTFLRDPLDRVLSFYKFCMHPDMQAKFDIARAARDLSMNDFMSSRLPEVCEVLDNQQTWQMASMYRMVDRQDAVVSGDNEVLDIAKSHLDQLSHVGFTETYDQSFTRIITDLGIKVPAKIPRKLRTRQPVTCGELSPDVLEELRHRQRLDYALYDYAKSRYARAS